MYSILFVMTSASFSLVVGLRANFGVESCLFSQLLVIRPRLELLYNHFLVNFYF